VERLFTRLDQFSEPLSLEALLAWQQDIEISIGDVEPFIRFRGDHYQRNLMHAGPAYHALVLCWRAGQRSPIHDHANSACAVKVLRGTATETRFERAPNGMIYATDSRNLSAGAMCASFDSDIHQISNLQAGDADLVTLHVYSPPLHSMNVYSLVDATVSRFDDPINDEFVGGSGI